MSRSTLLTDKSTYLLISVVVLTSVVDSFVDGDDRTNLTFVPGDVVAVVVDIAALKHRYSGWNVM